MKKELTTVIMVMVDGKVKPLEDLTEEEHSRMLAAMAHRLTESMSDYYAQHPDEVKELVFFYLPALKSAADRPLR